MTEPAPRPYGTRGRDPNTRTISLRMKGDQLDAVRLAAEITGQSMREFVGEAVRQRLEQVARTGK